MQNILLTGAAGFIGSNLARHLVKTGKYRVISLDKLTYAGNKESLSELDGSPNHIFVQGDVCDGMLVLDLLHRYECHSVIHLAAESHVDRSIGSPGTFVQTNVVGTFEMLEAAREYWQALPEEKAGRFRFVHISTDEVFGSLGHDGKFTESTPYAPNSPYSASKASSDHLVRSYHETFALPTITTNCSNNYGPFQFPEKLIPLMVLNAVAGKPLPVYGTGLNVRDWLHVEDHCAALQMILEAGRVGQTYNIGGDAERSNLEVVHAICESVDRITSPATPSSSLIQFVQDRPGHDFRYAMDASKLASELGWKPAMTFERGIEETVRWYLSNTDWVKMTRQRGYGGERLGLSDAIAETSEQLDDAEEQASVELVESGQLHPKPVECDFEGVVFEPLRKYDDQRGWLIELFRNDELPVGNEPVMAYVSQTLPGVSRGPHEHVDQSDLFAFFGPGDFRLYLWDAREDSPTFRQSFTVILGQSNPQTVIVPPGVVHAYKNVSPYPGIVFNAPNRLYAGEGKKEPVDEIRHEDIAGTQYELLDA